MAEIPIKTEGSIFTDQQWEAIHLTGSNLLISASAGSGKTMVLVNRIIEQIKKGTAIDELLVVTFTNAAAKEMKQRIQKVLQEEINADPQADTRHHLVQQLPKLGHADISTLHSFCLKVIERYYYLIDFDPVFRQLTDDTEIELIKEEVWDELLEALYEEADPDFIQFMQAYAGDRNDDNVTQMVFQLHEFSRANVQPKEWLDGLAGLYEVPNGRIEEASIYKDYLKKQFVEELVYLIQLVEQALNLANDDEHLEKQIAILENEKSQYEQALRLLEDDQLQECYNFINAGYKYQTLRGPAKKSTPAEVLEVFNNEIKHLRNEAKKGYEDFEKHFVLSPAEQVKIIEDTQDYVQVLAEMTQQFAERYQTYKAERKLIDFNDLEHLTLQILMGNEEAEVSEAAVYYQNKFAEVLVDEYQDINTLQEAILRRLTRQESEAGNYFMVGDVKQSIYGFRLADPTLFLSKYEAYAHDGQGERIILAENFRSRQDVLAFTNFVFTQLMDHEVGNLDYDENAELVYGNTAFDQRKDFATELLVYEQENKEGLQLEPEAATAEKQITEKTTGEILMVAARIHELIEQSFEIYDKETDEMRPLEYRDIVLLTPTKSNNLEIQEIFQEANIPSAINETQNFFQTTEVTIMMSLLKIIDNPRQDIPLVATLRSPIIGLNEIELTYIRLEDKQADFYDALLAYASADFEDPKNIKLQKTVQNFIQNLNQWREYARRHSVVDLLRELYQATGYLQYVGGMSGGKQRKANLEALYERAAAYEQTSFKGLYRFIRFIDKMQEKDKDLAEPTSILSEQNAVRVMTIHASKGLEFPVVFVMDMSKQFNRSDWTGEYVFDRDLGIGLQYKNPETRVKTSTLIDTAIKEIKKQNAYAEEMRVLYVALTRAEQKLFLVGTKKTEEKAFEDWDKGNAKRDLILSAQLRLSTNNYLDWIGMATARHQLAAAKVHSPQENQQIKNYPVSFSYNFYSEAKIMEKLADIVQEGEANWLEDLKHKQLKVDPNEQTKKAVRYAINLANYEYPYHLSTETTSYQSVSEVKQLFEEPNNEKLAKIDWNEETRINRYTEDSLERPKFLQEATPPTAAEIGQATHFLLQKLDLREVPTAEKLQAEITRLVENDVLNEEAAKEIELDKIIAYFQTPFGQAIIQHHQSLQKEVLFSLMMNANDVFTGMEEVDDSILIHGIIDGYFETEAGFILFDYKTDRVAHFGAQAEEELLRRYKGQIMLYKRALETITNQPVIEANIISLDLTKTIPLIEQ
jgi:ATP-dependent helicase/nuclease subunit A